jgi:hypothetical protein
LRWRNRASKRLISQDAYELTTDAQFAFIAEQVG